MGSAPMRSDREHGACAVASLIWSHAIGSSDAWHDNMSAVVSPTRRSNSAKPEDLVKVLRAHLPQGLDKKYLDHEPGMLVQAYEDIISDVLLRTSRPTKSLLQSAAVKAWQNVKTSEAETWGSQVAKAVSWCYNKRLQVSTGVKLNAAVRRIIQQINKQSFGVRKTEADIAKDPPSRKRALKPTLSRTSKQSQASRESLPKNKKRCSSTSVDELRKIYGLPLMSSTAASSSSNAQPDLPGSSLIDLDAETVSSESSDVKCKGQEAPAGLEYFDSSSCKMVRWSSGKKILSAQMTEGPNGFALVEWPGESPVETEIPNLALQGAGLRPQDKPKPKAKSKAKGKAKGKAAKRPAAAPGPEADAPSDAPAEDALDAAPTRPSYEYNPADPVPENALYSCMYYKNNAIGIRITVKHEGGKLEKQVFSFGGTHCGKTEEELRDMGRVAVAKMKNDRQPPAVVKTWCDEQIFH